MKKAGLILFATAFLALLLWLHSQPLSAQEKNIFFRHLNTNDGLSHNSVYSICEDNFGFIWIGTRSGLNRFDGNHFKVYDYNNHSLRNSYINVVFKDSKGRIWVGTQEGGLSLYNADKDTFISYINPEEGPQTANHYNILSISEDSRGRIWVGTHDDDLYWIDVEQGLLNQVKLNEMLPKGFQIERISSMHFEHDTVLWLGTFGGLFCFNQATSTIRPVIDQRGFLNSRINCLFFVNQREIWLGTTSGIVKFDTESHQSSTINSSNSPLTSDQVRDIERMPDGRIMIATDGGGLNIYNPLDGSFSSLMNDPNNQLALSNNSVYDIFIDRNNGLWVGNYLGGINYYNKLDWKFLPIRHMANDAESLSDNHVRTFFQDRDGNIWIGTLGGLNLYNPLTGKFMSYTFSKSASNSLSSNAVLAIFEDREGYLWIGTFGGGISIFDKKKGTFRRFSHPDDISGSLDRGSIYSIKEIGENKICIASLGGIYILDKNTDRLKRFTSANSDLSNNTVKVLCKDRLGNLWIGTNRGLNRFDPETEQFDVFLHSNTDTSSLSNNMILSLLESADGQIWIGTEGGGVNIFDPSKGNFRYLTTADGLPDNVINGILQDNNGAFWFSTNRGIACYRSPQDKIINYTVADGLQGNEFNQKSCFKARDGKLYFGGSSGFNAFSPGELILNNVPPKVFLTELYISNKLVNANEPGSPLEKQIFLQDHITLYHNQSNIEILFSALGFISTGKCQYSYIMKNVDAVWTDYRVNQSAVYSNLAPGHYTFMVNARNTDGVASLEPTVLTIRILPPWWKSWWAYLVYSLVTISLMVLFIWINTLRLNTKHLLAIERIEKENIEALNHLKMGFFTNISHEFKTPLTLILGHLDILKSSGAERKSETIKNLEKETKRLLYLINQLLEFRKAESGLMKLRAAKSNLFQFLEGIKASFDDLAGKKNIRFELVTNREIPEVWIDAEKMEKVMYNLLSNAFKYTDEGGVISILVDLSPGYSHPGSPDQSKWVEISVVDTGVGIASGEIGYVFDGTYHAYKKDENDSKPGGSGIGLAFSKKLVELHHGAISVESSPGQGSTFKVKLPVGKNHLHDDEIKEEQDFRPKLDYKILENELTSIPPTPEEINFSESGGPIMLVVDDNPQVCEVIKEKFISTFQVITAPDGQVGLSSSKKYLPDIIISDIMMPVMDGIEFCRKVKQDISTSHIPVILLTAKSGDENQIIGMKTGADAYLSKPYNPDILQVTVDNLISNRKRLRDKFSERPDFIPSEVVNNKLDEQFLEKIIKLIEDDSTSDSLDVTKLSREVAMSRSVLYRKLKSLTGNSIQDFVRVVKLRKAARLLLESNQPVSDIAFLSGFQNSKHFSTAFKKQFGKTPTDYRTKA